jgi:hypothetical protein
MSKVLIALTVTIATIRQPVHPTGGGHGRRVRQRHLPEGLTNPDNGSAPGCLRGGRWSVRHSEDPLTSGIARGYPQTGEGRSVQFWPSPPFSRLLLNPPRVGSSRGKPPASLIREQNP